MIARSYSFTLPPHVALTWKLTERSSNVLEGTIDDEIFLGDWTDWRVRVGATVLSVGEGNVLARARRRGDAVTLSFPPEAVLRLEDRESAP